MFLDLPAPWEAAQHAHAAMRKDRVSRICCFSPCIEQVLRTVSALNDAGFSDITLFEVLLTPLEVSSVPTPLPISTVVARLQAAEGRKEERRQKQIAKAAKDREAKDGAAVAGVKRSHDETGTPSESDEVTAKRLRGNDDADVADTAAPTTAPAISSTLSVEPAQSEVPYMKPLHEVRGHTSYLTFACLRPQIVPRQTTALAPTTPDSTPAP